MTPRRSFFIMIGALVLSFALLIGAVVGGNFLLKQQSDKLLGLKLENRILDEQQIALKQATKDVDKYSELEKIANAIVPQDKDQAKTVREIINLAQEANVPIASVAFPTSTLGQAAPAAATPAAGSGGDSAAPAAPAAPPVTQVTAVSGIAGVYQMQITVQSDTSRPVPYSSLIHFLGLLENNRRTAQVANLTILPYTKDISQVTFTLGVNVFIKP